MPKTKTLLPLFGVLFISILILLSTLKVAQAPQTTTHQAAIAKYFTPREQPPEISAHAYIVKIIGVEKPLLAQRSWKKLPPASLSKLLTAVLALEELAPDSWIKISKDAKTVEERKSSAPAGEEFLRDDLIALALLPSANDAALALAEAIGEARGGKTFKEKQEIFIALTNEKLKTVTGEETKFANPTGLDDLQHRASAEDFAKIGEYIWRNHLQLLEISRMIEKTVVSHSGREYHITNTNELLKEFPAIRGGKTGFTDEAKGTLILFYPVRGNATAIIVILGSPDRFGDGRKIIQWLENINSNGD